MAVQLEEIDGYDRKAATLLTPIGVLVGLGINAIGQLGPSPWRLFFDIGLLLLLAGFVSGIYSLRPRPVRVSPTATGLWPAYADVATEQMLADECSAIVDAYKTNGRLRGKKSPWIQGQFWLLVIGSPCLTVGYAINVAGILK